MSFSRSIEKTSFDFLIAFEYDPMNIVFDSKISIDQSAANSAIDILIACFFMIQPLCLLICNLFNCSLIGTDLDGLIKIY